MMRYLIATLLTVAAVYCAVCGLMFWQQRRFIYVPDQRPPDIATTHVPTARTMTVHTADGLDLLAWYAPAADASQPTVLYLHGNGGSIGYRAGRFARLASLGWGVMMLEYRGYGGNPGTPTETGLTQDAQAGYNALLALGIPPNHIILWGESLGTGVAVRLAASVQVGAVLLEAPYTSIGAIAKQRFPWLPVDLLLRDRFDLIGRIGAVHAPVLVMTGARDTIVPPAMGKAVYEAANEPKQFWLAPDAGHNDLAAAGAFDVIQAFVRARWRDEP
jgi:fermentation-respiration switch protein FrsA (DUF1100 family)